MADALTSDLLCRVCEQPFCKPKELPCLHSFCLRCLEACIESQSEGRAGPLERFTCPACGLETWPPREGMAGAEWALSFPTNFFLLNLVDQMAAARDGGDRPCEPCSRTGASRAAAWYCCDCREVFCDTCRADHEKFRMSAGHRIVKVGDLRAQGRAADTACAEHGGEKLNLFCTRCDRMICQLCFIQRHEGCGEIRSVKTVAAGRHDSQKELIGERVREVEALMRLVSDRKRHLTRCKDNATEQLRGAVKEIEVILRRQEELALLDLEQAHAEQQAVLDKVIEQCEEQLKYLAGRLSYLDNVIRHANHVEFLTVLEKMKSTLCQKAALELYVPESIEFIPNQDFLIFVQKLREISLGKSVVLEGKLDRNSDADASAPTRYENVLDGWRLKYLPNMVAELCARLDVDEVVCDIAGLLVLPNGCFLVSDFNNHKVKLFEADGRLREFVIVKRPRGMCVWSDNEIIVSQDFGLGFISEGRLARSVSTETRYDDVRTRNNDRKQLICSAPELNPPAVDVISPSGHVLSRISRDPLGNQIIENPWYLCITGDEHILVSDVDNKCLLCMDLEGKLKFNYHGDGDCCLVEPHGVTVDNIGNIYLVDGTRGKAKLYKLSASGKLVRTLLDLNSDDEEINWECISIGENGQMALSCGEKLRIFQIYY